jgi:chromatin assembly factor 1 subunit A
VEKALFTGGSQLGLDGFPYLHAFNDILCRVRDHTDPILKLRAIRDFKMLSQDFQQSQQKSSSDVDLTHITEREVTENGRRRLSLNPSVLPANLQRQRQKENFDPPVSSVSSEEDIIVQSLKHLLLILRPKTIFRDLQYIAVFVSSDNLHDADLGQAFLHVGLAALAWKDEVCRAMVDVADRIVAKDSIKRNVSNTKLREPSVLKAMEYWIIGAREGNAIAQRELASLYLTHPDVPPIVSLPLALSSDIFKKEMMWEGEGETRPNTPALCLALHWMQEASRKKDAVAQTKLREREVGRSIR